MSQPFLPNSADAFDDIQAQPDSVDFDTLLLGFQGVGVVSGCAVTEDPTTPDMTVDVAVGVVVVNGGLVSVSAQANNTIGTADGSNPRIDLVSVNSSGTVVVTAGTAAATPEAPAIPATSVPLAFVLVPASDTAITDAQIVDKRVSVANAGTLPFAAWTSGDYVYMDHESQEDLFYIKVWDDGSSTARTLLLAAGPSHVNAGDVSLVNPANGQSVLTYDASDHIYLLDGGNKTRFMAFNAGDLRLTDGAGTAVLTWDESEGYWVFGAPARVNEATEDTGTVSLDWSQSVLNCQSASAVTVNLPDNATYDGKSYLIRRDGANSVTINRAGTDTFDDAATSKTLGSDGASIGIFSIGDGEWKIVGTTGTVT